MAAPTSIKVFILLTFVGYAQAAVTLTAQVVDGVSGQQNPCLGQDIIHTCTFPPGQILVNMIVRGENGDENTVTVAFGNQLMRTATFLGNILTANLTSSTSAELLIEAINSALNRSTVTCEIPGETAHTLMVSVLGSASGPVYAVSQNNFESLNITVHRPDYGWECVDSYTVIAQSNAGNVVSETVNVTTRGQPETVVPISGLDMCRNMYFLTTFATSDGDRGQNFTLQGPYLTNPNVLSNVVTSVLNPLPLITILSWSVEPAPQPSDCVMNYSLSFNGNSFITSNTSVMPSELVEIYGFPLCMNQFVKISPIIPVIGEVESSSTTVMIRVEEGFQAPQGVTLGMFNLSFDETTLELRFQFGIEWNQAASMEVNASVGFATGNQTCIPSSSSSSNNSHTFSSLDPQLFVRLPIRGCVSLQKSDCISTNESTEMNAPIAITASSLVSREGNGFETTVTRNPNFAFNDLQVTITPDAQSSVIASGDIFRVTFFDLKDDTTYSFSIQAQGVNGTLVGIPITGTFRMVHSPPCDIGCIIGVVICSVLLIVVVIIAMILLIKFRYDIHQWCHRHCVSECCSCCSEVEETDTHELKSRTNHSSSDPEQAPEYAVVDKRKNSKEMKNTNPPAVGDTLYQDPTSIQHEMAPTGDVYAVTEKKQKKKGPTEAELVLMYSVPDKSKGGGLTYASLDMPSGGGGSEVSKTPAPTEYATVVK